MDIITNAVFATITGAAIAIASVLGLNPTDANMSTAPAEVKTITVCGSAGLLPADVTPAKC